MAERLPDAEGPRHEPEGVNVRAVLIVAGVLAIATAGTLLIVEEVGRRFEASLPVVEPPVTFAEPTEVPPSSVPQVGRKLNELRSRERRWLAEYSWVDRNERISRIPIERAMEIAAERGFQPIRQGEHGDDQRPQE